MVQPEAVFSYKTYQYIRPGPGLHYCGGIGQAAHSSRGFKVIWNQGRTIEIIFWQRLMVTCGPLLGLHRGQLWVAGS